MLRAACIALTGLIAGCAAPRVAHKPSTDTEAVVRGAEPELDHFALAAKHLDEGDTTGAIPHLRAHVEANPKAVVIRTLLAESHFKLGEVTEAKAQFTRLTREAAGQHLVQSHTRLREIAAAVGDSAAEAYHRGVGLVLLVRQWDTEPSDADLDELTETTLVQALAAFNEAKARAKTDPRVYVYLAESLDRLGQHSAAQTARRQANDLLPDSRLNSEELRRLRTVE